MKELSIQLSDVIGKYYTVTDLSNDVALLFLKTQALIERYDKQPMPDVWNQMTWNSLHRVETKLIEAYREIKPTTKPDLVSIYDKRLADITPRREAKP